MSTTNTGIGPKYHATGKLDDMEAYDRLPAALRAALQASDHNWSGKQCYVEYRKPKAKRREQFATIDAACAFIKAQDDKKHHADVELGEVCLQRT